MKSGYVLLAAAAAVLAPAFVSVVPLARTVPAEARRAAPVDRFAEGEEARLREGRGHWIEEMHRTPPGVDWRAVERENALARMEARNARAEGRAPRRSVQSWVEIGSRNLAGRMHVAALSAAGDSLYAGSSRGGVWKADLLGNGWRPIGDNLWGGAHSLAVAAGPPEVVTRLTDDGALHYTDDGGATWHVPAGTLDNIVEGKRLLTDPGTPNRVYLLVRKQIVGNVGKLYRSDDGGKSYTRIRSVDPRGDIWIDRVNGGRLWLLEDDELLYTDDGGTSWLAAGVLPVSGMGDVVLTGSEAGAPTFYAATLNGGTWNLYRSTDAGATWTWRFTIHDFWETLNSSIGNADLVLFGGVELWRSVDGGGSFAKVNGWGDYYGDPANRLHADMDGLDVLWDGAQEMHFIATDGGLYRSDDGVATVSNLSLAQLRVSQYYDTHTSVNDATLVLAGAQDQGYQRTNGAGSGSLLDFDQLISGDYGHLTSGDGTHAWVFSVYPGFVLAQRGELAPDLFTIDFPAGENHSWMPYVLADPLDPDSFFFCGNHIVRYQRAFGTSWVQTAGAQDLTANGGSYTTALAISPIDPDARLSVTDSGLLWWSTDGGATWTMSADTGPSAHYFYGTALEFSPDAAMEAVVAGSGYGGPAAYRTTDGGITWAAIGAGLPPTLVYDIAYEPGGSGAVHAATEDGGYRFDPQAGAWASLDDVDAPLTTYWSVEAVPAGNVMRYGTYGRGIWDWGIPAGTAVAETSPGAAAGPILRGGPNPFTDGTSLRFTLAASGPVSMRVVDAGGRRVRDLAVPGGPGERSVRWDGRDETGREVAAGVYFVRLRTADGTSVRRLVKMR